METYYNANDIDSHIKEIDLFIKNLFEGTKTLRDLSFDAPNILDNLEIKPINKEELFSSFFKLIKKELAKRGGDKLKNIPITLGNIKFYYIKLVEVINSLGNESMEDKIIQIFGNLFFEAINKSPKINSDQKILEASNLENFLLHKTLSVLNSKNSNSSDKINAIIKLNHLIFFSDDTLQVQRLMFFLIINEFINQIYGKFSNYNEYALNLYYFYYKYSNDDNIIEFREKMLKEIDSENYSDFKIEMKFLNDHYIEELINKLEILKNNNELFQLNINQNLLNNERLLKLFNLKKINEEKLKKFFRYNLIERNYRKYASNIEKNFEISVDDLEYTKDKLNVFSIFFLIACGLANKIDKECLQIFNEDNKVITLFKKYGEILLDNLNENIKCVENQSNDFPNKSENLGFGKIFNSFHVLFTDLNDDKYKVEDLIFDLTKDINGNNGHPKKIAKIKIITKSEKNTNFTRISGKSNNLNDCQHYHEKINSNNIEKSCKTYILNKITDLIEDNIYNIEFIELYKILFSVNYFIPHVDKDYSLKFLPLAKQFNFSDIEEYGYQEFDLMFKVNSENNIYLNQIKNENVELPFVKSNEIEINSINKSGQNNFQIKFDNGKEFSIKKNALVIIENKIQFPNKSELLNQYITVMLKKLNFILKLIKNTSNNVGKYDNIQLLLIYDELIHDSEKINQFLNKEDIKKILTDIPFNENAHFTIEIIYMSQIINYFNISKMNDKMKDMKKEMKNMDERIKKLERLINSHGLPLPEDTNKP